MPDTQVGGLSFLSVRRWRGGKTGQPHIAKANQGNEARKALCSLRLLLFLFPFGVPGGEWEFCQKHGLSALGLTS